MTTMTVFVSNYAFRSELEAEDDRRTLRDRATPVLAAVAATEKEAIAAARVAAEKEFRESIFDRAIDGVDDVKFDWQGDLFATVVATWSEDGETVVHEDEIAVEVSKREFATTRS